MIAGVAVWGINDILKGGGSKTAAKVGNSRISEAELDQVVQNNKMRMMQNGIQMNDQFNAILRNNALINLVGDRLLRNEFHRLHIEVDSKDVLKKDYLSQQDFDKSRLVAIMRSQGGEEVFLDKIAQEKKIDILQGSLTAITPVTNNEVRSAYNYENEVREISYIELTTAAIKDDVQPSDAELNDFYESNKDEFITPEYRSISYIVVTDTNEDKLHDEIGKINDKIAGGETLEEIAKEYNTEIKNIKSINTEGQAEDGSSVNNLPKVVNVVPAIFATSQGDVTDALEENGGKEYVFIRVDSITEKRIKPLDEVKQVALTGFKTQAKAKKMVELAKSIDEELKANKTTIAAVAQKYGLEVKQKNDVSISSKSFSPEINKQLLDVGKGSYSDVIRSGNSLIIAQVTAISQPKDVSELTLFKYKSKLQEDISREIMAQYLDYLRDRYNVTVYSK